MADDDNPPPRRGLGGEKKPTINDVARLAGVSKKTVSRVINQSPFVKDETREKINAIIADLNSGSEQTTAAAGQGCGSSHAMESPSRAPSPARAARSRRDRAAARSPGRSATGR